MNNQENSNKVEMKGQSDSSKNSSEQRKKTMKRNGWICLALMLVIAVVNGSQVVTGVAVDVLQAGLLVGAIVCFIGAARIKVTKSSETPS